MAAADTLRMIANSGCNLTLVRSVPRDLLFELAAISSSRGARLTVSTEYPADTIRELCKYGSMITFIEGVEKFEKD